MTAPLSFASVKHAAAGRWLELLPALGVYSGCLKDRHGPCPGCGGKDRFRFDDLDGNGSWVCGGGGDLGAGDGFALLEHVFNWTPAEALNAVAAFVGTDVAQPIRKFPRPSPALSQRQCGPPTPPQTVNYAQWLWRTARREDAYVAAHHYAASKEIAWAGGAGRGIASGRVVGEHSDCIIAPIRNIQTDQLQGVQVINAEGAKQTFGRVSGGALILGNVLDRSLPWFVVEGWADAVSLVFHIFDGCAVALAAFGSGSMRKTAQLAADVYRPDEITIVEDAA